MRLLKTKSVTTTLKFEYRDNRTIRTFQVFITQIPGSMEVGRLTYSGLVIREDEKSHGQQYLEQALSEACLHARTLKMVELLAKPNLGRPFTAALKALEFKLCGGEYSKAL